MGFRLANVKGRAALVVGENYYDLETISGGELSADPMAALHSLEALSAWSARLKDAAPSGQLADADLEAPVPLPGSCFAIGLNYRGHAEESRMAIPDVPMVFTKFPACIVGPSADIVLRSDFTDFEAELVVVVGKGGKNIAVEDAWNHVAGLCVGQDITDRPIQFGSAPPQFNMGKSLDTYGPIGPILVSPDEFSDRSSLSLFCAINGETRQKDNTDDLIFDVQTLLSYLSQLVTLRTGDVIFTGTPAGVGALEGRFLKNGDIIETMIEGIGSLRNRCVRGDDHPRADIVPEALKKILDGPKH